MDSPPSRPTSLLPLLICIYVAIGVVTNQDLDLVTALIVFGVDGLLLFAVARYTWRYWLGSITSNHLRSFVAFVISVVLLMAVGAGHVMFCMG